MDPFSVAKLGDVTIQRVTSKTDDSKAKSNKDCENETIPNNIASQILQLSKLSPSINITVKSNSSNSLITPATKLDAIIKPPTEPKVQTDSDFTVVSLGPGVELRRKENPKNKPDKNLTSNNVENIIIQNAGEKEPNEHASSPNNDEINCDNKNEKAVLGKPVSCVKNELHNDELSDIGTDCDKKMDFNDSFDTESKTDNEAEPNENTDKKDDKLEQVESSSVGNLEDDFREDGFAASEAAEEPPAPLEEPPGDLPEDIVCKDERFSDKEPDTSESEEADDEFDKEDNGTEANIPKKKKKRKPKSEPESGDENEMKKQKTSPKDEITDSESNEKQSTELKKGLLRKNIREVMDETKLEEATLAAQRQEMERRRRVQEQQRIIRDVQRQIAQNRQNSKMQARVLSLLQKGVTSIIKKEDEEEEEEMLEESKPNTVVVKLSTGSGPPQIVNKKVLDLLKQNSAAEDEEDEEAKDKLVNLSINLDKPQMMTPSVSIAPIKQESKPIEVVNEQEEEKPKDVVMISSSSGEEDDCIVISEEEEESEPDEDPTNSGMHTNDLYNVPDEQGRVLINVGHPESEKDVFLAPQIARIIKPHQIGGVRFLFDNIVESLSRFDTSEGFGCILAHSMGLGKTLQVVSFCDVFLRYTEGKTVLCIMPINTLQNWVAEFNMWLPTDPENSPLKEQGEVSTRQFPIFVLNDNQKTLSARANVIQNWNKEGGVLLIGYELYRQLSLKKPPKSRNRSRRKTEAEEDLEDEKCKNLLETIYSALVKPGPDLVICDEGHRIKNSHASISQALKQIRSKRRVVLTGYPLQNNLMEYWCMVDFVRPNYLGTKTEFSNMFERPIQNGQCIDSTPQDIKLMRYRAHVLHSLLEGFVQRRSHSVLQQTLPTKYEYVLLLRLTPLQKALYNTFMNEVVRTKAVPNPLKAFAVCCKIWNHPDILYNFLKKRAGDEELDLDIEDTTAGIGTPASGPSTPMTPSTPPHQAKRSRASRGSKASKEAKLPRKNSRNNSSSTNAKTPLIAAVPPNTANTSKPASPEQPTNPSTPMAFDSFGSQFQNFNQTNENFGEFNSSSGNANNFNNQFNPEFRSQSVSNNQEFNNANYQQNFGEANFYNSGYPQNNYWQGNNDAGGNFYNANASTQPSEEYFQNNTSSNTQYRASEYGGSATPESGGNFNNSNFNFDLNSQLNYANEFAVKQDPNAMFGMDGNPIVGADLMMDSGANEMSGQGFTADVPSNEANFRENDMTRFANQNLLANAEHAQNDPMISGINEGVKNRRQNAPPFQSPAQIRGQMNSGVNYNQNIDPGKGGIRMAANRARSNPMLGVRSGPVGRPRNNANFRANKDVAGAEKEFKFKPGLPGGAPVLKHGMNDGQNFQNMAPTMDTNQTHLLAGQLMADELSMFSQGQMNANFLDSLRSEELWNPNTADQNTLFNEQNYIYDDANQMLNPTNANFIANEAPALLPRASRGGLINEIPSNDNLFGGVAGNYAQNNATEHDLFAIENFNYLNELQNPNYQMSSHTSFMGLLEGDDSLGITRNASAAGDNLMKTTQFAAQSAVGTPMNEGNFMDPALQFQNASLLDQNNAMAVPNSDLMPKNAMDFESNQNASAPLEKDVNQSLMGLTRRGQITLKVIDKKNEAQPKLNEQSVMEQSGLDGGAIVDALASPQNQPAFGQNRLPSINVFNTSQNFVSTARMNQESSNFAPMAQFSPYGDAQSAPSTQCATTWDNFDASASAAKYPMQRQSSVSEESQFAFNQNQIMQAKESPQYDHRTVTGKSEPVEEPKHQMFNADNRTMFKKDTFGESYQQNVPNMQPTAKKDELHNQYLNSAQNEQKKINEENSNKNIFQTPASTSKPDTPRNAGKFPAKLNPPGASKVPEKKPAARRNVPMSPRAELAKPYQKSEPFSEPSCSTSAPMKPNPPTTVKVEPKDKPSEGETDAKMPAPELPAPKSAKEEPGIPYDWTNEYFKDYEPGKIEASAKTLIFFCMLEEIIRLGDRLLLFSQSLFTLDLIEDFLQMFNIPGTEEKWARNKSYFRLDGSTTALEREKLINEFNSNPNVHLFLVSTRAGSLGINLVGANRVVVFDASWNPCHDTQAVCRVYRYGQQKCCYVYRFVMDNCLEKKIYDRQINKQGMSDRIVDECNPDAHLTIKDVSNLCWDNEDVSDNKKDFTELKDKYNDCVIQTIIERFSSSLSKEPFQHESLLVDRKDNKLSQAEKRMAKRSYELEKQASLKPSYGFYNNPHAMQNRMGKPMASVRPMQADNNQVQRENLRRWIPADVWQKQGMSAQEMTLPLDVVIPTNTSDSRSSIVLKAGQKVMVLKSPKGIYMQLENGKIIAIKTAMKPALGGQNKLASLSRTLGLNQGGMKMLPRPSMERPLPSLGNRRDVTVSPIRNRFVGNMRTNTNLPIPGMRPGLSRGPRPGQPIVRTFPLARSQSPQMGAMGSRLRVPVPASKQIFGPNSSVTISLANKKKMESQEHGNLTEVNYEDYNPASRSKEAQNTSHGKRLGEEGSKSEHAEKRPMQFSDFPSMDEGTTSKAMDSLTSFATSQMEQSRATGHGGESSKMNVNQANTRFADVAKSSPKFSDVIPESLRFKKDINLTPVKAASQMKNDSGERSVSSVGKQISDIRAKTNQNMAQQHYQMQQQKLNQTAKARRDNLPAKSESNLARGGKTVKPETSGLSIPEAILGKKDVQVVRNSEPVTKSNSQHSISIFPVGKKQEDAARGVETSQPSPGFETSKGNPPYFSDYQKSYRDYYQDGNKPTDSSQYSGGSYDAYKSNYQSNFPQHQSQEYASSQHPYASSQYPSASYASHDYGSGTYSGDNSSHYVNSMFSNQSHTSNSNSFNSYDQYSWQNFPQTSKTDSSQHLAAQSSNAPSQPPSQ